MRLLSLVCLSLISSSWAAEEDLEEPALDREKRQIGFPFVIGDTILDIQCKRGYYTVCAPDGPNGCPSGYSSQTNVGVCGFATLNHYLNTSNIAGTCCYKAISAAKTTVNSTVANNTVAQPLIPQIIAYPVYAQYPFAVGSNTVNTVTTTTNNGGTSSSYGSSSYASPASSSYSSPSPSPSSSYSSPTSSYGRADEVPQANERQYGSPSPSSYSSPSSSYSSPSSSYGSSSMTSGTPSATSGSSSPASQLVVNPSSISYPPLLNINPIPAPSGTSFNQFPPAMVATVYGSSTPLVTALQTLAAQIISTPSVSSATVSAVQNALVLAINTPGWTSQLTSAVQAATSAAAATSGINSATSATITAINQIVAAGGSGNSSPSATSSPSSSATSTAATCSATLYMPILRPQFQALLQFVIAQGCSSDQLQSFINVFNTAPIINANQVAILQNVITGLASCGSANGTIQQSLSNLNLALSAYTVYNANGNTVQLLQTLYQLSGQSNPYLGEQLFGGLGAMVAMSAGLTSIPSGIVYQTREILRLITETPGTPLQHQILAGIINCRLDSTCCVAGSSSTPATTASPASSVNTVMAPASSSSYYQSYSAPATSSSSYSSPASYSSPSPSPSPSYSPSPSPSPSSYSSPSPSPSPSYSPSPSPSPASYSPSPSPSPSSYGSSPSSYGSSSSSVSSSSSSSSALVSGLSGPILAVNQSAVVNPAVNGTTNIYPPFLPIYPVLQAATGGLATGGSLAGQMSIPASNNSAYNYGYPSGLPQYPVPPYYVNAPQSPANTPAGGSSYGSSSYSAPAPSPSSYGSSSYASPVAVVTSAPVTTVTWGPYPTSNKDKVEDKVMMVADDKEKVAVAPAAQRPSLVVSSDAIGKDAAKNKESVDKINSDNVNVPKSSSGEVLAPLRSSLVISNASNVAIPSAKAFDICGVPHATQEGDIAFLIANGQKGPRVNIYRAKRESGREARVTNSMVAQDQEVCWMAAILLDGKYQSGASIVSEWYVLTAAHEVDGRDISRLRIRVGDNDVRQGSLDKDEKPGCIQDLLVDKIILHPDFDRKTLSSDIGLIKLKQPIDLGSPCVCKVCLQEEGPQEGETCIISGFGSTRVVDPSKTKTEEDAFALSGPNAEILRYAGIPIVANDVCSAAFKNEKLAPKLKAPFGILDDTQLCAGGISQRDACYGDGGSPLVCYNGRSFYQAGVVSYGRGCGKALMAAVYGSVTAATPWITEEILSNRP